MNTRVICLKCTSVSTINLYSVDSFVTKMEQHCTPFCLPSGPAQRNVPSILLLKHIRTRRPDGDCLESAASYYHSVKGGMCGFIISLWSVSGQGCHRGYRHWGVSGAGGWPEAA